MSFWNRLLGKTNDSIGVLFVIDKCDDACYGAVFEKQFFAHLDMQRLVGAHIFIGDIVPECRFYCIRVDGPTVMIRYIRKVFSQVRDIDALRPVWFRFISGRELRRAPLVPRGWIDQTGSIV